MRVSVCFYLIACVLVSWFALSFAFFALRAELFLPHSYVRDHVQTSQVLVLVSGGVDSSFVSLLCVDFHPGFVWVWERGLFALRVCLCVWCLFFVGGGDGVVVVVVVVVFTALPSARVGLGAVSTTR